MHTFCIMKQNTQQINVSNVRKKKEKILMHTSRPVEAKFNRNGRNTAFSTLSFLSHKLHIQTLKIFPCYATTNASLQTHFARALPAASLSLLTLLMPSAGC